jgi:tRNA (cmo5U34)-methyltransferase
MANARDHSPHDWLSPQYVADWISKDADRRPLFDEVLNLSGLDPKVVIEVLDLGGGYGMFGSVVLERFPGSRVTVQDYSAPMLEQAREYLAAFNGRTSFVLSDLREHEWVGSAGGPFDLVVSARAIHTIGGRQYIADVYKGIHKLLKPGGMLLDCDYTYTAPLADHLMWLEEAGFEGLTSKQQDANLVIITARKRQTPDEVPILQPRTKAKP